MKKLLIVTDAWSPQINGVVTTFTEVIPRLRSLGVETSVVHPGMFKTFPMPGYPEIRLARNPWLVKKLITDAGADAVHVATEGPLGVYARNWLQRKGVRFTTSLHTKFPEYLHERSGLPISTGYRFLRWFHQAAAVTLCTTNSHRRELQHHGLSHLRVWGRGVDTELFRPARHRGTGPRPVLLYVGRISVEKNLEAFLSLDIDAELRVAGDGPARRDLEHRYPDAVWLGYRTGQALVDEYARADVFVFPSRTDTFGLVMLEAMACGTPVAAYPVTGPVDVIDNDFNGYMSTSLLDAVQRALVLDRANCRTAAQAYSWQVVADRFAEVIFGAASPKHVDDVRPGSQNQLAAG
ncbi:MAG: glycosyltransferase family 1 protein [Proteobacteria bacterium]|nr:glycosyltransferase family 1 protein [Pseudomonadota bacterium]